MPLSTPVAWLFALLLLTLTVLAPGCDVTQDPDDDTAADDDTGDDDADFTYLRYDYSFDVDGDQTSLRLDVRVMDEAREVLCTYPIEFQATYAGGDDQGGTLWTSIDGTLTMTSATDPGTTDCGPEYGLPYHDSPASLIELWSPLAFYSCDVASTDEDFLGDDPTGSTDGTFAQYCNVLGPGLATIEHLGPIEAIWLAPGVEGQMDGLGDYSYLPGADGETYWILWGFVFATQDNESEPQIGLSGSYVTMPMWLFVPY